MNMEVSLTEENNIYIIDISGDLDASSAILLDQEIEKVLNFDTNKLLIDCSKLNYISSAGLGVFMSYMQDFKEKEIKMVLYGLSEKVKNVFKILGLDSILPIVENKNDAIEA